MALSDSGRTPRPATRTRAHGVPERKGLPPREALRYGLGPESASPLTPECPVKNLLPFALLLAVCSCTSTGSVEWVDYGDDPMQNPQYMTDSAAAGTPGPQHEALAARAGSWNVEGKVWMEPGADAMPMPATAQTQALLGGRTIIEEFKSDFMGMPFEGRLLQGYDNLNEQYWCLWTDNMSTGYWLSHGTEISPGTIDLMGTAIDVLTPKGRPVHMMIIAEDDGSYTMKMFDTDEDGDEHQTMELHYTRG